MTTDETKDHGHGHGDELAPEPDTRAGGVLIVAMVVLTLSLAAIWLATAGLYRQMVVSATDANSVGSVNTPASRARAWNAETAGSYGQVEVDGAVSYRVPVSGAAALLLARPELVVAAEAPSEPVVADAIEGTLELPEVPSLDAVLNPETAP